MERRAVSEVAGTMILIGIIVVGMIIVNLVIFSSPNQGRVPSLRASLTNRSTLITIVHQGGDALWPGEYQILVDGVDQTGNFLNSGSAPWSIGDTLSWDSPTMPHKAVMVYNGSGRSGIVILETKFPWGVYVPSTGGSGSGSGVTTIVPGEDYPWYDCSWGYRKNITIDHTKVSGTQTSFPVLISLSSDTDLSTYAQAGGNDILFTTSDGLTKIPHEIESYSAGTLVAWVKVPSVSSAADTTVIMYYGNSGASSQQDAANVWDSDYRAVWHHDHDLLDSTSNNNDGTNSLSTNAVAKIGRAQDYPDVGDTYVDVGSGASIDNIFTGGGTVSAWIYPETWGWASFGRIADKSSSTNQGFGWSMMVDNVDNGDTYRSLRFGRGFTTQRGNWVTPIDSLSLNQWQYVVVTYNEDSTANDPLMYVNGVSQTVTEPYAPTGSVEADDTTNMRIGNFGGGLNRTFVGLIDEIRLSTTIRSAGWITTEYNNQNSPSTFSSVGVQVASPYSCSGVTPTPTPTPSFPWYNCNWDYRKNITIDHTKVSGTQTNFPVLISLSSDSDLSARAQPDGDDILFTSSDGITKIPHEIESYSGGTLVAWVKVPSINSATDTTLLMYYGNSGASSQQDSTNVWDSNYRGVWHLGDSVTDNTVTAGAHTDSTTYGNNGKQYNNSYITGKIGGGQNFEGDVRDEFIEIPNSASLENVQEGDYTVESWFNPDATPPGAVDSAWNAYYGLVIKPGWHIGTRFDRWAKYDSDHYLTGGTEVWVGGVAGKSSGQWYHVVGVVNRTFGTHEIFVNGVSEDDATFTAGTAALEFNQVPWRLGIANTGRGTNWEWPANGKMDEARISSTARSPQWITTEYNNQNSPSTFSTVGSQVAAPASCGSTPAGWYSCDWGYRKIITIDHTKVTGTQANFPVLVNLTSDSDLKARAQSDGDDIFFSASDGITKIPHEIEYYNPAYGGLIAWVKVPSIDSSTDATIMMYYGNSGTSSQQDVTNVWTNGYTGVWHLKETSGGSAAIKDSTSNGNHGTDSGSPTLGTSGRIGKAIGFDGTDDRITIADPGTGSVLDFGSGSPITISAWFRPSSLSGWTSVLMKGDTSGGPGQLNYGLQGDGSHVACGYYGTSDYNNYETTGHVLATGTWYYSAFTYTFGSGSTANLYVNGTLESGSWTIATGNEVTVQNNLDLWFGDDVVAERWTGIIDEVRIASTLRSAGWIATEYANQNSPSTFISVGSQGESGCSVTPTPTPTTTPLPDWYDCSWAYRKTITIDHTKVSGTQSNFPVLVNLTSDTSLKISAQADGDDILFTSSDGTTKIPHEIEYYNPAYGGLTAWVKVASLSSSTDTVLQMYYGYSGASSQQNPTGVWDANYDGVWHLGSDLLDSTNFSNDGTDSGGSTSVAGKVGSGRSFDGSDDYIYSTNAVADYTDLTVEAWVKTSTANGHPIISLEGTSRTGTANSLWDAGLYVGTNADLYYYSYDGDIMAGSYSGAVGTYNDGSWHHVVGVSNSVTDQNHVYVDGSVADTDTHRPVNADTRYWRIGSYKNLDADYGTDGYYTGQVDEVRISASARSAQWIATEYANMNSPSTFSSLGTETGSGCSVTPTPTPVSCTLAVDATSTGQNTTPTSGITISHTTSGSDRLMLVGVSINDNNHEGVSSVTYNGVALTKVGHSDNSLSGYNDARTEIWRLVAPATGTHNVVITFNQTLSLGAIAGVMTFTGVDQTTPLGTFASNEGDDQYQINVTVPSETGEIVFGVLTNEYNSVTSDAGQTERWNIRQTYGGDPLNGVGGTKAGAASVMLKWSLSSSYNHWAAGGVSIKSCSYTPTPTPTVTPTSTLPTPTPVQTPYPLWYPNCGWPYRKNITLNGTMVPGAQSSFPVLISIPADNDLKNHARSDGFDILFTSDDGQTELAYERESYDSSTGALNAWVNVPTLNSGSNTTLYMYYGFPSSPEMANTLATWDTNFHGIWHLNNAFTDSSTYGNHSTNYGTTDTAGKIARGRDFDGTSNWIKTPSDELKYATDFTISAWFNADATAFARQILWEGNVTGDGWGEQYQAGEREMAVSLGDFVNPTSYSNRITFHLGDTDTGRSTSVIDANRTFTDTSGWHYVAVRATGIGTDSGRAYLYLNGTQIAWDNGLAARTTRSNWTSLRFGRPGESTRYFDGQLDEVRISTVARSASWIQTEYNNQNTPSLFHWNNSEETYFCGGIAAPVYVQSESQSSGAVSQAQITLPGSSTNGDLLVISVVYDSIALSVSSITDSKGNTYTAAAGPTTVGGWGEAYTYYAKNIAGGGSPVTATVTLSGTPPSLLDIFFLEYAGVDTVNPLDQTNAGSGSGTAMDSGTRYLTEVPQLVYGFGADDQTCSADSPYTQRESTNGQCAMDLTAFSSGYYHVTATQNPTGAWLLQMATFKGA